MKIKLNEKFIYVSSILFITFSSFYYGYIYSIFNTDIHHYSIILEPYFDILNDYKINKDIFVLYGNGQIHLFKFLSNFFEINLVTIGIINQLFFSIKFILFFFILKFFVNDFFSIFGTFIYYFLYTFVQTPTSDVLASFFLHLFILLYLYNYKSNNIFVIFISSFILFFSIYFRHTYVLNFAIFIPLLFFLNFFFREKFLYEIKILIYFLLILFIFFIILYFQDRLILWFEQSIGIGLTKYLDLSNRPETSLLDTFYKLIYYFARVVRHILIPNSFGSSYFFSIIILFNFLFISKFLFQNLFSQNKIEKKEKFLFFLSLLAFSGTIQLINKFETSRYINASFPFIIIFVYIIFNYFKKYKNKLNQVLILTFLIVIFIPVILKYPFYSNFYNLKLDKVSQVTEYRLDNKYFTEFRGPFLNKKKFNNQFLNFYKKIQQEICEYDGIYNLSFDRSFQYLCKSKKKYIPGLYFRYINNQFTINDFINIQEKNKILITHDVINNLELISTHNIPKFYSYTKSDIFFGFFPEKIYFYK